MTVTSQDNKFYKLTKHYEQRRDWFFKHQTDSGNKKLHLFEKLDASKSKLEIT